MHSYVYYCEPTYNGNVNKRIYDSVSVAKELPISLLQWILTSSVLGFSVCSDIELFLNYY